MEIVRFLECGDSVLEDAILARAELRSNNVEAVDW